MLTLQTITVKDMKMNKMFPLFLMTFLLAGCTVNLMDDITGSKAPLTECVLTPGKSAKVAVIGVNGVITDEPAMTVIASGPSLVESVVSQLRLAKEDRAVKAVVIKINSPGGGVTATDVLWREIVHYKSETGNPVVVSMMDIAASGGYYLATAADSIYAAPSTLTGSIGVIIAYPNFAGLMDKLGVKMQVYKSGGNKDIISMFRDPSDSDKEILQSIVQDNAQQFWSLVKKSRKISDDNMEVIKTARVFSASQALKLNLIDQIGYPDDAIACAAAMAGQTEPTVVTYRQHNFPNDNIYNTRMSVNGHGKMSFMDLGAIQTQLSMKPGFYYLWLPAE